MLLELSLQEGRTQCILCYAEDDVGLFVGDFTMKT